MKTQSTSSSLSRRRFFRTSLAASAAITLVPRHVLGGPKFVPPSEKVNIAQVGVGGQGFVNTKNLFQHADAQIIAVCDPAPVWNLDRFYYKGFAGRKPVKAAIEQHYSAKTPNYKCAEYEDFREMLEKEKSIDAVLCATPDHLHASVSVLSMRAGKHIYCEKPLTHNIWEARYVAQVAKETGVATQMGNQGHSDEGIRLTCEWIWDGAIGPVREVHVWTKAVKWFKETEIPREAPPAPEGFNWNLWCGPREVRPYHPLYCPVSWRSFWAFGSSTVGDMACHNLDPAFMALKLDKPESIEATAPDNTAEICPTCTLVTWRYPARGEMPPVKVTWYDGGLFPPRPDELEEGEQMGVTGNGILFYGDKGVIMCPGWAGMPRILPDAKMQEYKKPAKTLPRTPGHHRDWLNACKGGKPASANFEYGAALTEVVQLANVALRTGKKIYWDHANMKVTNASGVEGLIKESYRKGWEIA